MARQTRKRVTLSEIWDVLETMDNNLTALIARWSDGVPAQVRAEIRQYHEPLLQLLIRAGRR